MAVHAVGGGVLGSDQYLFRPLGQSALRAFDKRFKRITGQVTTGKLRHTIGTGSVASLGDRKYQGCHRDVKSQGYASTAELPFQNGWEVRIIGRPAHNGPRELLDEAVPVDRSQAADYYQPLPGITKLVKPTPYLPFRGRDHYTCVDQCYLGLVLVLHPLMAMAN